MWFWSLTCNLVLGVFLNTSNVVANGSKRKSMPFKDVFVHPPAKPSYGTGRSSCWGRGGICVRLSECKSYKYDTGVPGCTNHGKVCCFNDRRQSQFNTRRLYQDRGEPEYVIYSPDLTELQGFIKHLGSSNIRLLTKLRQRDL